MVCNIFSDEGPPVALPDLQAELRRVAEQYWLIGCYLNLTPQVLQDITTRNRYNVSKCLDDVLKFWFDRGESVTWYKVAHVMDLLLCRDISTRIRRTYCGEQVSSHNVR